jgi:ribulose-5-phosphate 4-epimerase/fuculose-1-phosphate aldolase
LRIELAAAYRYFAHMHWDEIIFNHITVKVPSPDPHVHHFLVNPFGLMFDEVTASSLVKIDIDGNVVDPGNTGN